MIPGIIVAGTHSGVGKTTVSLGIMSLLVKAGFTVQGFKVGPDYIDPSFHRSITGRDSENLDSWMTSPDDIKRIYHETAQGAKLAVIEGVMGLFDGTTDGKGIGSTAHIAKILGLPVILVVDTRSVAQSVAPLIKGFVEFDRELQLGGIILNRVGSEKHVKILTESIQSVTDKKIFGCIPRECRLNLPERHLGLVPLYENPETELQIKNFTKLFQETIQTDRLIDAFRKPSFTNDEIICLKKQVGMGFVPTSTPGNVRIGVVIDEAFGFYYQDNFRLLERAGAELVRFSTLHDPKLPDDLDGLYVGGGYPEIFAAQLAANNSIKEDLRSAVIQGIPTYAECGGLMYMTKAIRTPEGCFPMLGLLDAETEMMTRREVLGYTEVEALNDNLLLKKGQKARGHEFHYSKLINSNIPFHAYSIHKDNTARQEGFAGATILASYVHLHFASNPDLAINFVEKCRIYRENRK